MTKLGVCYYPEHWPEKTWADDARRMAEAGLSWVRIGEFAWSRLEPTPGKLEFEWLDRAIQTLGDAGLQVVLGTPTATPPRWMLDRHPDMLAVDASGQTRIFGSRRHYDFSHSGYRDECRRIATLLAERYGRHPHVQAWQIDNEYACHDTVLSYSDTARGAFRDWLAQKYQSPDALNRAWGNVFWSMEYSEFGQIDLPNATVTEPNPAHVMDFRRFASDQVVAFNRVQAEAIRAHSDRPLIHNYMGSMPGVTDFDHYAVGGDLDVAAWDSYPLGFLLDRAPDADEARKARYVRQGDPDFQAFHHDLYRRVGRGRLWVIEQQPGPVNWAAWNAAPLPGMVRLWTHEAAAHGAEAVCYFRWRQAPFAQEQHHAGLLRPDSASAPGLDEATQTAAELAEIGPVPQASARIALVFDYASQWAWEVQPQGADFSHLGLIFAFYRGLRRLGVNIDIIAPGDRPDGYNLILVPGLMTLDRDWEQALAASGALVMYGPRSNAKTADMSIPVPLPPALEGLRCAVARVETLPPGVSIAAGDGAVIRWNETLETNATTLIKTDNGAPVLVREGQTCYLGGWPDDALLRQILKQLCRDAGIRTTAMPEGIRQRETREHVLRMNYGASEVEFEGLRLPPAGVVWTKK